MNKIIAVVDDEKDILDLLEINLKKNAFLPVLFENGSDLIKYLNQNKILPALIILDLMLPLEDGFDICKRLKADKQYQDIPIIMLTAKDSEIDKVIGLEIGADDYLTKPFSVRELMARVKVIIKRSEKTPGENEIIKLNNVIIYPQEYTVIMDEKKLDLTTTEFKILELLASNIDKVFSRDKILQILWGYEKAVLDRTIDVHIKHLREKLGKNGDIIKNIRGIGYKITLN